MTQDRVIAKKKLIEVALPLDAIDKASEHEKQIKVGKPTNLHLWWARRPLSAARAVVFAQMVDDPSANPDLFPTEAEQEKERQRLFRIIEDLVLWENTANETVLQRAREEIWESWRRACAVNADHPRAAELFDSHVLPAFHDPFAGGGVLPLEAQRLGLEAYASDLNPVAVLINKAMIEIPPAFAGSPPINPAARGEQRLMTQTWRGAQGLSDDIRYYGQWMCDEAEKRIGHLYPSVAITESMARDRPDLARYVGRELTVIGWIWARTVKSPNPAFADIEVPLASTFMLSAKAGKEAYVEPIVDGDGYHVTVKVGSPPDPTVVKRGTKGVGKSGGFRCLMSGMPIPFAYVRAEMHAGRGGARLLAVVVEGDRGRVYLPPTEAMETLARSAEPSWEPGLEFFQGALGFRIGNYGMSTWGDLFTSRQLVALTTFADLIDETRRLARSHASAAGLSDDTADAYVSALAIYLGLVISRLADWNNSLARWESNAQVPQQLFGKQVVSMTWDYCEANPLSASTGSFRASLANLCLSLTKATVASRFPGHALLADAQVQSLSADKVVSTDPPYYASIGYADLSDFFYVWLRRALRNVVPELFVTLEVPKTQELVATPDRHGGKDRAEGFFITGMTEAIRRIAESSHPAFPVTIYYAYQQSNGVAADQPSNPGWVTFLEAIVRSKLCITGTWPVRTENPSRQRAQSANALASSIVLVCRPLAPNGAMTVMRSAFQEELRAEMSLAVTHLQRSNIAPVDLAQAAIGPGMAVFTKYREVLNTDGTQMSVREALDLINATLSDIREAQLADFDAETRWAITWAEQFGYAEGDFGTASMLATAKVTSVDGMREAGILTSGRGKVRLLKPSELATDWDPATDRQLTIWELTHQFIRALESSGEAAVAALTVKSQGKAELARELAYHLYIANRTKRATDAMAYNGLVQSWPEIMRLARERASAVPVEQQAALGLDGA